MSFGRRTAAPAPVQSSPRSARLPVLQATTAERTAWTGAHSPRPAPRAFVTARAPRPLLRSALAGLVFGAGMFAAYVGTLYPVPFAGFDLVQVQDGAAYVVDTGLTADDCRADLRTALAGFSCELPR